MNTSTVQQYNTLLQIFDAVQETYPIYKKIYTILSTHNNLSDQRIESLYNATIQLGSIGYKEKQIRFHTQSKELIERIKQKERTEENDADFLLSHLLESYE